MTWKGLGSTAYPLILLAKLRQLNLSPLEEKPTSTYVFAANPSLCSTRGSSRVLPFMSMGNYTSFLSTSTMSAFTNLMLLLFLAPPVRLAADRMFAPTMHHQSIESYLQTDTSSIDYKLPL